MKKIRFARNIFLSVAVLTTASISSAQSSYYSRRAPSNGSESIGFSRSAPTQQTGLLESRTAKMPFSPGSHNAAVSVGQVFLAGSLADQFDDALGTQAQYSYGVSDLFAFETSLGYSSHSRQQNNLSLLSVIPGVRTNLIFFDQLIPYAAFGLGFFRPSATVNNVETSGLLFGLNLGTGIDLVLSERVFFGTRLTYSNMFNTTRVASDGNMRNIGGAFVSFLIHAGASF
jgi:hypothetical protein